MGKAGRTHVGQEDLGLGSVWDSGERERRSGNRAPCFGGQFSDPPSSSPCTQGSAALCPGPEAESLPPLFSLPHTASCQHKSTERFRCTPSPASSPASTGHSALLCPQTGGLSPLAAGQTGLTGLPLIEGRTGQQVPGPICSPLPSTSPLASCSGAQGLSAPLTLHH